MRQPYTSHRIHSDRAIFQLLSSTLIFWNIFLSLIVPVEASNNFPLQQASITFPPTEDRGAPARTRGSANRGSCSEAQAITTQENASSTPLTALMPDNNVGTTLSPNPAVYLYVPETSGQSAEFTLYNWTQRQRKPLYEVKVPLQQRPGIVKVSIPKNLALEPQNTYAWVFSVICNAENRSQDQSVSGWIERIALPLEQQASIDQLTQPLERANRYAAAGIWYETLAIAEELRTSQPKSWEGLLDSVGLSHLAKHRVVECCQNQIGHRSQLK
ncbi:MAG: DUF928 domain-containing protein [Microcoleaceae cyanobacterium]